MFNQKVIIIYGQPGSGKGTQAELLAKKRNFIHFDTGKYIESLFNDKKNLKNPVLKREKENFEKGKLCTPSWVLDIVKVATDKIYKSGFSLVFSGSPRTLFEAVGDENNEGLIDYLIKRFKRKNIFVFFLKVSEKDSFLRNKKRLICSFCGLPFMFLFKINIKKCNFCGGELMKRVLDKPEIIKIRLKEFKERTYPLIKEFKNRKIKVFEINGKYLPYKVHQFIIKKIK